MDRGQFASDEVSGLLSDINNNIISLDRPRLEQFLDEATTKLECDRFLRTTKLWDTTRSEWHGIPTVSTSPEEIYGSLKKVLEAILVYFNHSEPLSAGDAVDPSMRSKTNAGRRPPRGTAPAACRELHLDYSPPPDGMKDDDVKFYPDGLVTGTDNHFEKQDKDNWFERCVAFFDVTKDSDINDEAEEKWLAQLGFYARECFVGQMTRSFVWGLVVTESRLRLFRFDRCGVELSDWLEYHKEPRLLIQTFLLVSNYDAKKIGLDSTVRFSAENRRTFAMRCKGKATTLTEVRRRFRSSGIVGRATMCWRVKNDNGQHFILKQQFVDPRQPSEADILQGLDVPGVVRMHAYKSFAHVSSIRRLKKGGDNACFIDRHMQRLLLDEHGSVLNKVRSRMQLLVALRDAVSAHQALWNKGILHGDISWNNILYPAKCDEVDDGPQGILIDFDRAINYLNATREQLLAKNSLGTHSFQSQNIRQSHIYLHPKALPILRDYMDDLESFFWILHWTTILDPSPEVLDAHWIEYLSSGGNPDTYEAPRNEDVLLDMHNEDLVASNAGALLALAVRDEDSFKFQPGWGPTFRSLTDQLAAFFFKRSCARRVGFYKGYDMKIEDSIRSAPGDYEEVLGYFNAAIKGLEYELQQPKTVPDNILNPNPVVVRPSKRGREAEADIQDENTPLEPTIFQEKPQRRQKRSRLDEALVDGHVWNQHPDSIL